MLHSPHPLVCAIESPTVAPKHATNCAQTCPLVVVIDVAGRKKYLRGCAADDGLENYKWIPILVVGGVVEKKQLAKEKSKKKK